MLEDGHIVVRARAPDHIDAVVAVLSSKKNYKLELPQGNNERVLIVHLAQSAEQ